MDTTVLASCPVCGDPWRVKEELSFNVGCKGDYRIDITYQCGLEATIKQEGDSFTNEVTGDCRNVLSSKQQWQDDRQEQKTAMQKMIRNFIDS